MEHDYSFDDMPRERLRLPHISSVPQLHLEKGLDKKIGQKISKKISMSAIKNAIYSPTKSAMTIVNDYNFNNLSQTQKRIPRRNAAASTIITSVNTIRTPRKSL